MSQSPFRTSGSFHWRGGGSVNIGNTYCSYYWTSCSLNLPHPHGVRACYQQSHFTRGNRGPQLSHMLRVHSKSLAHEPSSAPQLTLFPTMMSFLYLDRDGQHIRSLVSVPMTGFTEDSRKLLEGGEGTSESSLKRGLQSCAQWTIVDSGVDGGASRKSPQGKKAVLYGVPETGPIGRKGSRSSTRSGPNSHCWSHAATTGEERPGNSSRGLFRPVL